MSIRQLINYNLIAVLLVPRVINLFIPRIRERGWLASHWLSGSEVLAGLPRFLNQYCMRNVVPSRRRRRLIRQATRERVMTGIYSSISLFSNGLFYLPENCLFAF